MRSANVLTGYGPPETLRWQKVRPAEPAAGQIRMRVRAAGVGPTDLEIRRGNLKEVFALARDAVLGFEQPAWSTRSATESTASPSATRSRPGRDPYFESGPRALREPHRSAVHRRRRRAGTRRRRRRRPAS